MIDGLFLKSLNDLDLIKIYGLWLNELKQRKIIRTQNVVGDIGEYLAIKYYSSIVGLPNLQAAPTGTQCIDAISREGKRYTIKSTTGITTGVFYGLNDPNSIVPNPQLFEYVIVVMFNKDLTLKRILEIDWNTFIIHKRWHSRMRAWNLSVNASLLNASKIIYAS